MSFKFSINSKYKEMLLVSLKKPNELHKYTMNSLSKDNTIDRKDKEENKSILDSFHIPMRLDRSISKIYKKPIIYKKMHDKKISLPNINISNSNHKRISSDNSKIFLPVKKKKKYRFCSMNIGKKKDNSDLSSTFIKKTIPAMKKEYISVLSQYACKSLPGRNNNGFIKTNQDAYLLMNKIYGMNNFSMFGIFDGHGSNGHLVSKCLKDYFMGHYIQQENFFPHDFILHGIKEKNIKEQLNHFFFIKSFLNADNLLKQQKIDMNLSGSTGIQIIHIDNTLYCVNTGDSRAIYINEDNDCFQISRDHKPILPNEKNRIESNGGYVVKSREAGPYRVYAQNEDYPGLAISRSFGDFMAKTIGVICDPDVFELSIIDKKIRSVVIASDGLWEFLTNSNVKSLITPFRHNNDCIGAAKKLVDEAHNAWVKNGISSDDITAIVLYFNIESKS